MLSVKESKQQDPQFKNLSDTEIQNIFFLSFQFSQGNPSLQKWILEQARVYYGPQKISKTRMDKLIENFTKSQTNHDSIVLPERLQGANLHKITALGNAENYNSLKDYLNRLVHSPNSYEIPLNSIIRKDFIYSIEGRPNRIINIDEGNPYKSRFFSYFCYFIICRNTTKNRFFDHLFAELTLGLGSLDSSEIDSLQEVVKMHNKYWGHLHPITQERLDRLTINIRLNSK